MAPGTGTRWSGG
uniref:Uncharacterized protein n=1 Tax=Arundo donax TaxID=35708 RepID=A0A0A9EXP8_ARUDO